MPQLRHPRYDLAGVRWGTPDRQSNNQLVAGRLCDQCRYETWCRRYGCCWHKTDLTPPPKPPEWNRETVRDAFRTWHERHGESPAAYEWPSSTDTHPGYST